MVSILLFVQPLNVVPDITANVIRTGTIKINLRNFI